MGTQIQSSTPGGPGGPWLVIQSNSKHKRHVLLLSAESRGEKGRERRGRKVWKVHVSFISESRRDEGGERGEAKRAHT